MYLYYGGECKHSLSDSSTQHMWELLAGNRTAGEGGSGVTAVHGCHCPGDMAVFVREVLAKPWVGVCAPLALSWS